MSDLSHEQAPASRPSETVAGFLAAFAIAIALIGLAWHPLRLVLPAGIIALVAAAMGGRFQRLAGVAVATVGLCFFFGMVIAIVTSHPLW